MSPLHPLTFELKSDDGTRARLGAGVHRALGEPQAAMPPRYIGEAPLVMSGRLHDEVTQRTAMLRDWVFAQHAAGRWRDDPMWGDIGPPDCLCVDLAIVRDDAAPGGWGVRWVEFQTFLSIAATVHALHVAACEEWPELAALRHWDRPRGSATTGLRRPALDGPAGPRHPAGTRAACPGLGLRPRTDRAACGAWTSSTPRMSRIRGDVLQARIDGAWRDVPFAASRLILLEEDDPSATARALSRARLAWRNHPAWFDRVHKGVLPELALAREDAARWPRSGARWRFRPTGWCSRRSTRGAAPT